MAKIMGMEETKAKPSKIRNLAVILGTVFLVLGLWANAVPAYNVISFMAKVGALTESGIAFLAGFALLVGLPILAILWGSGKLRRK